MMLGLSRPNTGSVSVYGRSPRDAIARGEVAAVMQTGGLLKDFTVAETVQYTASLYAHARSGPRPAAPPSRWSAAWAGAGSCGSPRCARSLT